MDAETNHGFSVSLINLHIGYRQASNEKCIFGPLNIGFSQSEMIGLIGRNGIGKSTLLRTIAGLQPQLSGDILVEGIPNKRISLKEMARKVSYVSTEFIGTFQLKVREVVAMGRFPYTGWLGKMDEIDFQAINNAVDQTGINYLLEKSIHEISDGERQKVMIARALAQDTPLIILDEPTAYLDLPSRYEILKILHGLTLNNHKTILFSTHDLSIAMEVADKLWLLIDNVIYEGAPEDLLISKVFRKLFINSPAEFDARTFNFRFKKEGKKKVLITGEKTYRLITKRAMERIGYTPAEDGCDRVVDITESEGNNYWHLHDGTMDAVFNSLYDLTACMKNLPL